MECFRMGVIHRGFIDLSLLGISGQKISHWIEPNFHVDSRWVHPVILDRWSLYLHWCPNRATSRGYLDCRQSDKTSHLLQQFIHGWTDVIKGRDHFFFFIFAKTNTYKPFEN
jgi:hypothetical protein